MKIEQELQEAAEARQLLEFPAFLRAKKSIDEQLALVRKSVPIHQTDMHTRLILMEQLWQRLLDFLEQAAMTGKFAELQLAEAERKKGLMEQGIALFNRLGRGSL